MKNISRRDFLKGALAGTAAAALSTVTGIPAFAEGEKLADLSGLHAEVEEVSKGIELFPVKAKKLRTVGEIPVPSVGGKKMDIPPDPRKLHRLPGLFAVPT